MGNENGLRLFPDDRQNTFRQRRLHSLLVAFLGFVLALLDRLEEAVIAATESLLYVDPGPVKGSGNVAIFFFVSCPSFLNSASS